MRNRSRELTGSALGKKGRERLEREKNSRQNSKRPDGIFDRLFLGEVPLWVNISPFSSYKQQVYDRNIKEVIETETTWFEYKKHWVPKNKGRTTKNGRKVDMDFICSCGPFKDQPCWGCSYVHNFWEKVRKIEEEKGFRPEGKPGVSTIPSFALAVTLMERVYKIRQVDSSGRPKKRQDGTPVYNHLPEPVALQDFKPEELAMYDSFIGQRLHWSLGSRELDALIKVDDDLQNKCVECADEMVSGIIVCPSCETSVELAKPVMGIDLTMERSKVRACTNCGDKVQFVPLIECSSCGCTQGGSLTSFDLRLQREKIGDTYATKVVSVRVPGFDDEATNARVLELIEHPLDLEAIFAPTRLDSQKFILGEDYTHNLTADLHVKNKEDRTESYSDSTTDTIDF